MHKRKSYVVLQLGTVVCRPPLATLERIPQSPMAAN